MSANGYLKPLNAGTEAAGNAGSGLFSSFGLIVVLVLAIFIALVVYHRTIGYYLEFGWNRIYKMIMGGESVEIDIGEGALGAKVKPMEGPPTNAMLPSPERPSGMPGATPSDSPLLSALSSLSAGRKEVFNVSKNIYTYSDAAAVCSALNSELATYEQVKEAHADGADWCNYGWVKGQMAVYPTQKATYEKLQKGDAEYRNACGRPGVNGGYFDNPDLRFGVTCYGTRPEEGSTDELLESQVALPPSTAEIEYDKKVQKFREQLATLTVLPFNRSQWSG
jgi:hypothetical protein